MKKEDFYNTKILISSDEEMAAVQKALFSLGFVWTHSEKKDQTVIRYLEYRHLLIYEGGISVCSERVYKHRSPRQIKTQDILPAPISISVTYSSPLFKDEEISSMLSALDNII